MVALGEVVRCHGLICSSVPNDGELSKGVWTIVDQTTFHVTISCSADAGELRRIPNQMLRAGFSSLQNGSIAVRKEKCASYEIARKP